ncbi:MAG TPA: 2-oxo acid dehydrogenase subunit E2 [candidate division Zixibacteria bacterium]|nr:2-oxo acid dehydrogenase subunit E2 [candidate division Zixibacteria bacterium]
MKKSGTYSVEGFSVGRQIIAEACSQAKYYNHIVGLSEMDVTKATDIIEKHKEKTGERLSFTSWVMKCVAQAVTEYKVVQSFRVKRKKKLIVFDDVDIKANVEKDDIDGKKIPVVYTIRKANEKSFEEIQEEIRMAQKYDEDKREKEAKIKRQHRTLMRLPVWFREFFIWRSIMRDPFKIKKNFGTIGVTAMGMFGKGLYGWAIPKTMHSTTVALGAIIKRPIVDENDEIVIKKILPVTTEFNHDIVDGGPAVRFVARLYELMDQAYGLENYM